jgi:hypothetical protein
VALSGNMVQQRIIAQLVRRNVQGWGKPLAFTEQRLRLAGMIGLVGLASILLSLLTKQISFLNVLFEFIAILALGFSAGTLWTVLPAFWQARNGAVQHITGTIDATICNVQERFRAARGDYHFITLRLPNNTLRPFAVDPTLHDELCVKGKRVTLTVIPGIDRIEKVE